VVGGSEHWRSRAPRRARRPPDPVYDDQGGIEGAATTVRDGDLTFSADEAGAPLRVVEDGASMSAHWTRAGPDGSPQPWVCLPFSRVA
jgi:hypothetical protein